MASSEGWEAAVRAEVGAVVWWDDLDSADLRARFKAFTGQRSDWPQPTVLFWKDLLLRVARRLRVCSAPAHHVCVPPTAGLPH
jgi:charged multivesicular body protein 7